MHKFEFFLFTILRFVSNFVYCVVMYGLSIKYIVYHLYMSIKNTKTIDAQLSNAIVQ